MNTVTIDYGEDNVTTFHVPLKLPNPLNGQHGHWAYKARVRKGIRTVVAYAAKAACVPGPPCLVTITRIAPSKGLDPHDGLPASCKPVVDAIADAMGIDDRHPGVEWKYAQERGKYGVRVRVER